jgi:hypothetical protein
MAGNPTACHACFFLSLPQTNRHVYQTLTNYLCQSVIRSMNDLEVQSKDAVINSNKDKDAKEFFDK